MENPEGGNCIYLNDTEKNNKKMKNLWTGFKEEYSKDVLNALYKHK